jgi:hypothetical protein
MDLKKWLSYTYKTEESLTLQRFQVVTQELVYNNTIKQIDMTKLKYYKDMNDIIVNFYLIFTKTHFIDVSIR